MQGKVMPICRQMKSMTNGRNTTITRNMMTMKRTTAITTMIITILPEEKLEAKEKEAPIHPGKSCAGKRKIVAR